jgi:hypothetical protein
VPHSLEELFYLFVYRFSLNEKWVRIGEKTGKIPQNPFLNVQWWGVGYRGYE